MKTAVSNLQTKKDFLVVGGVTCQLNNVEPGGAATDQDLF